MSVIQAAAVTDPGGQAVFSPACRTGWGPTPSPASCFYSETGFSVVRTPEARVRLEDRPGAPDGGWVARPGI